MCAYVEHLAPTESGEPQPLARVAGAAYALVIILGMFNGLLVDSQLLVAADDAATTSNILQQPTLFRVGMVLTLSLYALVLLLAWALYGLLKVVSRRAALVAMLFRLAEGVVGISTILISVVVADLLGSGDRVQALGEPQLSAVVGALIQARTSGMDLVLFLIGIGGSLFCVLLFRSRFIPRWLSFWGVLTYVSMFVLALVSLLWPQHPRLLESILYGSGALCELTLGAWLLLRGVDLERWSVAKQRAEAS